MNVDGVISVWRSLYSPHSHTTSSCLSTSSLLYLSSGCSKKTKKNMTGVSGVWLLSLLIAIAVATSSDLPLKLEVKIGLNSRLANVHLSKADHSAYPFTVTYGACHSSASQPEAHHTISTVHEQGTDRLVWILPEDITANGCLSAWSIRHELTGRSEPLMVNKYSRQWMKKRELDQRTMLSKRASIPMNNASGIDAEGPWFDGVELLREKEIGSVNAQQAKAKSRFDFERVLETMSIILIRWTQGLPL